jgi:hypothetical protein
MASQGLSHLLAMAIPSFWTTQDECRNPRPDPPDELCQPVLGRALHPWRIAQARRRVSPLDPFHALDAGMVLAYFCCEEYKTGLSRAEQSIEEYQVAHVFGAYAASATLTGRVKEAKAAIAHRAPFWDGLRSSSFSLPRTP